MLEGKCHCGEAGWTLKDVPESVTVCNCTVCSRYGVLWAYGYMGDDIHTMEKQRLTAARMAAPSTFVSALIAAASPTTLRQQLRQTDAIGPP